MENMNTTQEEDAELFGRPPLVYQIRSLRQWHGDDGLSQRQLSELANINERKVRELESCRVLPASIREVLAIAIALDTTVEELVIPDIIADLHAEIATRRLEGRKEEKESATAAPPNNLPCQEV